MNKNNFNILKPAFIILFSLTAIFTLQGQEKKSMFRDSTDMAFDVSDFLLSKTGLLPVPMLITEPAVGYGGVVALVYFHDSYENKSGPPSVSGAIGGGTQNGTWMAGGFHAGFWKEDRIRYVGAAGLLNVNIDYYGSLPKPLKFNSNLWFLMQQIQFRISDTDLFLGVNYTLSPANNKFEIPVDLPEFEGFKFSTTISEVSALITWDSRNNVFSPSRGILAQIKPVYSDTWMGGGSRYGKINMGILGFTPVHRKVTLGGKVQNNSKLGDIPFYIRPYVHLRGVPMVKYQDNNALFLETELDWNVYKRWHLIGFTGFGTAFDTYDNINNGNSVFSGGGGFRYLLARKFGLKMGMDFAFSPDEFAFYVTMGHAWAF